VKKEFILDQSTPVSPPWPSKESLMAFHNTLSQALDAYQKANPNVPTSIACGCALQLMLNFPHKWMAESGKADQFVSAMTTQAEQFVALKAMAVTGLPVNG
jgi:hypothetical protein